MSENDPFDLHETEENRKGGTWNNVVLGSWEAILKAASGDAQAFVWIDEGRFKRTGSFEFNAQHHDFQPLLVDKISAQMIVALHDVLKPENQAKIQTWVGKSRGHFAMIWELTQEKVTITGFKSR